MRDPERTGELSLEGLRACLRSLPLGSVPVEGTRSLTPGQIKVLLLAAELHPGSHPKQIVYGEFGSLLTEMCWRLIVNLAAYDIEGSLGPFMGDVKALLTPHSTLNLSLHLNLTLIGGSPDTTKSQQAVGLGWVHVQRYSIVA